jgi:multiple sugar transport system ATP-binding protein
MADIVFDSVTKRYPDGTEAVTRLDLEIADGEFLIFVGPSGCGKSTALRMVAGLEEISDGELRIAGEVVNDRAPKDRDIAMVFQSYALYPQMTVRQNMGFALKLAKVPKADIEAKVGEAAEILDLTEHLDRKPGSLSGGQRQRVAMGRAIVRAPKAFLMDEPLSNLDAKLRVQMRASIARIQSSLKTTMIYVTHDQVEAMTLGHRVAVMRKGVLQQVGPPSELYGAPVNLFVAAFIGSPPMNFVPATLDGDNIELPFGRAPLTDRLRRQIEAAGRGSREVLAGIRPEQFEEHARHEGGPDGPGMAVEATVELVEELGAEALVHFKLPAPTGSTERRPLPEGLLDRPEDGPVVARLGPGSGIERGGRAKLWLNTDGLELFDAATGLNLRVHDSAVPSALVA